MSQDQSTICKTLPPDQSTICKTLLPDTKVLPEFICQIHENRIQDLEQIARETSTNLGIHGQRIEDLSTKLDSSVVEIGFKLNEAIRPLGRSVVEIEKTLQQSAQALERSVQHEADRVAVLEENKLERDAIIKEKEQKLKDRRVKMEAIIWTLVGGAIAFLFRDGLPLVLKMLHAH